MHRILKCYSSQIPLMDTCIVPIAMAMGDYKVIFEHLNNVYYIIVH